MKLFSGRKKEDAAIYPYHPDQEEAVLKSSICTGEKVAGFRNRTTGRFTDICVIRSEEDLQHFLRIYGIDRKSLRTIY